MRPDNWREPGIDEDEIVEFDIHCKMNKAWANEFLSFLKTIESFGKLGCSRTVALYADGDGDFRPKFNTDFEFKNREPINVADAFKKGAKEGTLTENAYRTDYIFDAG